MLQDATSSNRFPQSTNIDKHRTVDASKVLKEVQTGCPLKTNLSAIVGLRQM